VAILLEESSVGKSAGTKTLKDGEGQFMIPEQPEFEKLKLWLHFQYLLLLSLAIKLLIWDGETTPLYVNLIGYLVTCRVYGKYRTWPKWAIPFMTIATTLLCLWSDKKLFDASQPLEHTVASAVLPLIWLPYPWVSAQYGENTLVSAGVSWWRAGAPMRPPPPPPWTPHLLIMFMIAFLAFSMLAEEHWVTTWYHHWCRVPCDDYQLRETFRSAHLPEAKPTSGHEHGQAAGSRSVANNWVSAVLRPLGLEPYFVQMSRTNQRRAQAGSRAYFWVKDLIVAPWRDQIEPNHVLTYVDTDFYMDMENELAYHARLTVLYTINPTKVCNAEGDIKWRIDENDELITDINGAQGFYHKLWNYNVDTLTARYYGPRLIGTLFWLLGLPWRTVTFNVQMRRQDDFHVLVALTPLTVHGLSALVFPPLQSNVLNRMEFARRVTPKDSEPFSVIAINHHVEKTVMVSLAISGDLTCVNCPIRELETVIDAQRLGSMITSSTVARLTGQVEPTPEAKAFATKLAVLAKHLDVVHGNVRVIAQPLPPPRIRHFEFLPAKDWVDTPKIGMVAFCNPLIQPCFAPLKSRGNDESMVNQRLKMPQRKSPAPEWTPKHDQYAREFITTFFAKTVPVEFEEIWDKQSRKTQRIILTDGLVVDQDNDVPDRLNMKIEAYTRVNDTRPLITDAPCEKVMSAVFNAAAGEQLELTMFYCGGMNGLEIATNVSDVCAEAMRWQGIIWEGDFSRMDGSRKKVMHLAFIMWLNHMFALTTSEGHPLIKRIYVRFGTDGIPQIRVVTVYGVTITLDWQWPTGKGATGAANMYGNGLTAWTMLREAEYTIEQSKEMMLKGYRGLGDDSITVAYPGCDFIAAAGFWGYDAKLDIRVLGKENVTFLNRVYSHAIAEGCLDSISNPIRTLSKVHMTPNVPLDFKKKMLDKAVSLYVANSEMPILADWCLTVFRVMGFDLSTLSIYEYDKTYVVRQWNGRMLDLSKQYPCKCDHWMFDYVFDRVDFDYNGFRKYLNGCTTVDDVVNLPMFHAEELAPDVSILAVVDGDLEFPIPDEASILSSEDPLVPTDGEDPGEKGTATAPAAAKSPSWAECRICGATFTSKRECFKHLGKDHPRESPDSKGKQEEEPSSPSTTPRVAVPKPAQPNPKTTSPAKAGAGRGRGKGKRSPKRPPAKK
jgi:hypothetical protein